MELTKILLAGMVGTTLMTIFSKVCGFVVSKEFSEAKFLDILLRPSSWSDSEHYLLGWTLHYLIGIAFTGVIYLYVIIWGNEPTYLVGIVLGGSLGCLGVLGWNVLILLTKKPRALTIPAFFIQLVFAHVVFGLVVICVFRTV